MLSYEVKLSLAAHSLKQPHKRMNTKNPPRLDSCQVGRVAKILHAYTHPFRYDVIKCLLNHGKLSLGELASYLNVDEAYLSEHVSVLYLHDLVSLEDSNDGYSIEANEPKLVLIKNSVDAFLSNGRL